MKNTISQSDLQRLNRSQADQLAQVYTRRSGQFMIVTAIVFQRLQRMGCNMAFFRIGDTTK